MAAWPLTQAFRADSIAPSLEAVCSGRWKAVVSGDVGHLLAAGNGEPLPGAAWGQFSSGFLGESTSFTWEASEKPETSETGPGA